MGDVSSLRECPRCGAERQHSATGWTCTCASSKPPTLQDLVEAAVGAADKGEEVPDWKEAAKWTACLQSGGDAALAFVRWLDFEQGIALASLGPGGCEKCLLSDEPDALEQCPVKGKHPIAAIPLECEPEVLLARMHGIDLQTVEDQRAGLVAWWRARG